MRKIDKCVMQSCRLWRERENFSDNGSINHSRNAQKTFVNFFGGSKFAELAPSQINSRTAMCFHGPVCVPKS